jgi:hypothetical protein
MARTKAKTQARNRRKARKRARKRQGQGEGCHLLLESEGFTRGLHWLQAALNPDKVPGRRSNYAQLVRISEWRATRARHFLGPNSAGAPVSGHKALQAPCRAARRQGASTHQGPGGSAVAAVCGHWPRSLKRQPRDSSV